MDGKEIGAFIVGLLILTGITYAIAKGDETAKILVGGGTALATAINATKPT